MSRANKKGNDSVDTKLNENHSTNGISNTKEPNIPKFKPKKDMPEAPKQ